MAGPFKMKGSPMARNFGAPFKDSIQVKKPVGKNSDGTIKYDWVSDGHVHPHPGGMGSDQQYPQAAKRDKGNS